MLTHRPVTELRDATGQSPRLAVGDASDLRVHTGSGVSGEDYCDLYLWTTNHQKLIGLSWSITTLDLLIGGNPKYGLLLFKGPMSSTVVTNPGALIGADAHRTLGTVEGHSTGPDLPLGRETSTK